MLQRKQRPKGGPGNGCPSAAPRSVEGPIRTGARALLGLFFLALAFLAGFVVRRPDTSVVTRQPLYYVDPMHPAYKSEQPGVAPDCGMKLEPVYAGETPAGFSPPGTVRITPEKQRLIGMTTIGVKRESGSHTVHLLGKVAADEGRTQQIAALADGVVRSVSDFVPGSIVHKDDVLATYFVYMREVYNAIQQYFVAMGALDQRTAIGGDLAQIDSSKAQVRLTEELLKAYGISETQMRELARTHEITRDIQFRSPISGVVLSRNAFAGQKVDRGFELYRIADIGRVWVIANLSENDSALLRPGSAARIIYQGRSWPASITNSREPDPVSRTLRMRMSVVNPDFALRPDQFVDVEVTVQEPEGITIPTDAVLDSGRRKIAFVSNGNGSFEARELVTGLRYGDRVQVVSGLNPGENIALSGLFLLDSESRLRQSAEEIAKPMKSVDSPDADPVCGMVLPPTKVEWHSEHEGKVYHFCSQGCKQKFDLAASRYVGGEAADSIKDTQ